MAMTVIVTRDVEDRYRGFLLSCMPEIGPGIYISPNLSKGTRERIWEVLRSWHDKLQKGSLTLAFADTSSPSGLNVESLGTPRKDVVDFDGFLAVKIHDWQPAL